MRAPRFRCCDEADVNVTLRATDPSIKTATLAESVLGSARRPRYIRTGAPNAPHIENQRFLERPEPLHTGSSFYGVDIKDVT